MSHSISPIPYLNTTSSNPRNNQYSEYSLYKSSLSLVNVCSGSSLRDFQLDAKISKAIYCTSQERLVLGLSHMYKRVPSNPTFALDQEQSNIGSLLIFSKCTRRSNIVDSFQETKQNIITVETEDPEASDQEHISDEEIMVENRDPVSPNQSPISQNTDNSPGTGTGGISEGQRQRDLIEQIRADNPLKRYNVSNMVLSPCGNRLLIGYENEQLKFWKLFRESAFDESFSRFSPFSDWR